jgi:hypothetical protein
VTVAATASNTLKTVFINLSQAQEEQQSTATLPFGPSSSPSASSSSASSTNSESTVISPELKAKMCDPNNPKLHFVNGTESRVCGIPKSIKNATSPTTTLPTPQTPILPSSPGQ